MINLIVILDPNYEAPLETVAQSAPVWIVASGQNKFASQRAWAPHPTTDHRDKGAVTCFDGTDTEDRLANLLNVLPTLEEHHGEIRDDRFAFPKGFALKVIGLPPANNVFQALQTFGFSSFVPTEHGFEAHV
jgi:hypothetical protein